MHKNKHIHTNAVEIAGELNVSAVNSARRSNAP